MSPPASGPTSGPTRAGIDTKLRTRTSSRRSNVRTRVRRPTGTNHGAATALQDASRYQHVNAARHAAEERAEAEDADRRGEDAACPVAVRHPPTHRDEDGQTKRVARQRHLHAERRDVQGGRNRRHRGVQDGRVERLHEERHGYQPGQEGLHAILPLGCFTPDHCVAIALGLSSTRDWEGSAAASHASYSWVTSSCASPSASRVTVMRFGRQHTAQSSVYTCRAPPPGSTKVSFSSPQNAHA